MTRIAFIGLGNMGAGMAANQAKAGHEVMAFDLSQAAVDKAVAAGCRPAATVAEAVAGAEAVITMLPAGPHVRSVYGEQVLTAAPTSALLIDCSTIDIDSARAVGEQARAKGFPSPTPRSAAASWPPRPAPWPSWSAARAEDYAAFEAILQPMARVVFHAGDAGAGQAAKICNNMLLGVSMIGVCEAFALAEKLGWTRSDSTRSAPSPPASAGP
jgi:3-hydroxyisobutyrate dehydrogenase